MMIMKLVPKRHVGVVLTVIFSFLVILVTGFLLLVTTRELPAVSGSVKEIINGDKADISFVWPTQGKAAIGTLDGGLKATYGSDDRVPTASMAKVITALVVLEKGPVEDNPIITMTESDVELFRQTIANNGSNLYIEVGEQLTIRQMIEALMLPSANNIADSLVRWAFGSQENYRASAEEWLKENNLHSTTIGADASGLDPGTTSSMSDLFEISRLALHNQTLREVMAMESTVFPVVGVVQNTNSLLRDNAGYIGLKTGNSIEAGSCLMFASTHTIDGSESTIIGVLSGQEFGNVFNAARALTQSAVNNLVGHKIPAGTVVGAYQVPWGGEVEAKTVDNLTGVIWKDENPSIKVTLNDLTAPVYDLESIGAVDFNGETTAVTLNGVLSTSNLSWRIQNLANLQW